MTKIENQTAVTFTGETTKHPSGAIKFSLLLIKLWLLKKNSLHNKKLDFKSVSVKLYTRRHIHKVFISMIDRYFVLCGRVHLLLSLLLFLIVPGLHAILYFYFSHPLRFSVKDMVTL